MWSSIVPRIRDNTNNDSASSTRWSTAGTGARRRGARPRPRRPRDDRRAVARVGAGLRERRYRREPAGSDHRARGPRARPAPHGGHEPGGLLRPPRGSQRGVRPRGVAGRFPHHPARGRPPARRAEPRGGPATRPGRGRRDRGGYRAGAAAGGGADRGRRLRDRGRDRQPADLGARLRAVRPPETYRSGGRQGKDLAERTARRELGTHHRRRGCEERLLRLRAGRTGAGGRGRPGGAGIRAGVPGGYQRLLRRGRPLGRGRHERDHQERHQRSVRIRRPLPARRSVGGPVAAVAARRRARRAPGRLPLRGGRVPPLQLGRVPRRSDPARPNPLLLVLRPDRPEPALPSGHSRARAVRRGSSRLSRAGGRLPAQRRRGRRRRPRTRPHRERAFPPGNRQPHPVRQAEPSRDRASRARAALQLHGLRAGVGFRRGRIAAVREEPLHGGLGRLGRRRERGSTSSASSMPTTTSTGVRTCPGARCRPISRSTTRRSAPSASPGGCRSPTTSGRSRSRSGSRSSRGTTSFARASR